MRSNSLIFAVFSLLIFSIVGCDKEEFATSSSDILIVSTDTVTFDTIFTQIGSVTKRFKVYNPNNKNISLSKVYIEGGSSSNFRMNLDGVFGASHENVVIPPKDSLYVFVEVTINPFGRNSPMVIYDAIVFLSNGNTTKVSLEAFGQDVHLINGEIIETQNWTNDKPYLIYNSMAIDSNQTLTIEEGVHIHFHNNSSMLVWGKLIVNGTLANPVVFDGDRFDMGYGQSAGRWGTIFIDSKSRGNSVNYAIVKNSKAGFQVGEPGENKPTPSLLLNNTFVYNTSVASVIAFGAEITAYNSIFADSQFHGLALFMGGSYNFYHSTVSIVGAIRATVASTSYIRNSPSWALFLSNYWYPQWILDGNFIAIITSANKELKEANFYNSIIYGKNKLEFFTGNNEETEFNYFFDNCILKQVKDSIDISDEKYFNNVLLNEYPRFVNDSSILGDLDYRLDTLSPAKDVGSLDVVNSHLEFLQYDYDGNLRTADGKPDLGAFERQE